MRDDTEREILARARRFLPSVEQFAPHLVPEIAGIGRGAGLTFDQVFFLQVATEVELEPTEGCSSGAFTLGTREPTLVQNWDHSSSGRGNHLMLRLLPTHGPEMLMFAHAGVVGYMGMNDAGLGHVGNQMYPDEPQAVGLTQYFVNRRLLEHASVAEALRWLSTVPMASSKNYIIGDASGRIVDAELGWGQPNIIESDGWQVHTNHYLNVDFAAVDRVREEIPDSLRRLERCRELCGPGSSEEEVRVALSDHDGWPTALCRHEPASGKFVTTASVIMRLRSVEMHVAYGNPCETPYEVYRLGPDRNSDVGPSLASRFVGCA